MYEGEHMTLTVKALEYIDINHFAIVDRLELIQGNSKACYVQLFDDDIRHVLRVGSTAQIVFPRALSVAAVPASQDVTVNLTPADVREQSIMTFNLTGAQTNIIASGGVKLVITYNSTVNTYPVDNFVRRKLSTPGA